MFTQCSSLRSRRCYLVLSCSLICCGAHCSDAHAATAVAKWKDNAKAAYSLTWDDGRPSQLYQLEPLYTSRGLHGTFYVNPGSGEWAWNRFLNPPGDINNGEGKLNDASQPAGWVYLPSRGHELGSHTLHHNSVTTDALQGDNPFPTVPAIYSDLVSSKELIENATGQKVVSFAYPYGFPNHNSERLDGSFFDDEDETYYPQVVTTGVDSRVTGIVQPIYESARLADKLNAGSSETGTTYTRYASNGAGTDAVDFGALKSYFIDGADFGNTWGDPGQYLPGDVKAKLPLRTDSSNSAPIYPHYFNDPSNPNKGKIDFRDYIVASLLYDKMLDDTIDDEGWGIEWGHSTSDSYGGGNDFYQLNVPTGPGYTYGDWSSINQLAYVQHLDNIVDRSKTVNGVREVWQDTVGNVTRYVKSREAAVITDCTDDDSCASSTIITVTIDDSEAAGDYDVPLTINTEIPSEWLGVTQVTQFGKSLSFKTWNDGYVHFVSYDAVPDGHTIRIFGTESDDVGTPVPEPTSIVLIVGVCAMATRRRGR